MNTPINTDEEARKRAAASLKCHKEKRPRVTAAEKHESTAGTGESITLPPAPRSRASAPSTLDDPILVDLSTVKPVPVTWLWQARIAIGKTTCIAGDPGLGKSFITLDTAARVSTGGGWADGAENPHGCAGVVLFSAEDDPADTLVPRLLAAGADCARITVCSGVSMGKSGKVRSFTLGDMETLGRAIDRTPGCKLVVIDPVTAYMGEIDAHKNNEVRAMLAPLAALAAAKGVAIVLVTHLNKGGGGKSVYRLSGSLAIPAAARTVWLVAKDAEDPDRRLMLPVKNNLAPDSGGLAYTISGDPPRVVWSDDPVEMTADEAMAAESAGGQSSKREAAAEWLRGQLIAGDVDSDEIKRRADAAGIPWRTVERAKGEAGAISTRSGFGGPWVFRLVDPRQAAPKTAKPASVGGVAVYGDRGGVQYGPGPDTPEWAQ